MLIVFQLPIAGVPKERPRLGYGGRVFTPSRTKSFEEKVRRAAKAVMSRHGYCIVKDRPIALSLMFFFEPPASWTRAQMSEVIAKTAVPKISTPDFDNLTKAVCDGMNKVVYADDRQVSKCSILKAWSYKYGDCVNVAVSTID